MLLSSFVDWTHLNQWLWDRFFQERHPSLPITLPSFTSPRLPSVLTHLHQLLQGQISYQRSSLHKYTPQAPKSTWFNQKGDCKDLSILAYFLLSPHTPVYLAFTSTSPHSPLSKKGQNLKKLQNLIPSLGWFNHVLLWIPSPNSTGYWLDLTQNLPLRTPALQKHWAWILETPTHGYWKQIQ